MRTDNLSFVAKNKQRVKDPRYAMKINFDPANPNSGINRWIGSHDDTQFPETVIAPGDTFTFDQIQDLRATTEELGDYHGGSCDFSDDGSVLITTAAAFDGSTEYRTGKLMIWDRNTDGTYTLNTTFYTATATSSSHYALFAAISGDGETIVVSSPHESTGGADRGTFSIVQKVAGTWTERNEITMVPQVNNAQFGWKGAISYDGNTVIMSAPFDPNGGTERGSVWMIQPATLGDWTGSTTKTEIVSSAPTNNARFGYMCTMSDNGLIAAIGENYNTNQGRVRIYRRNDIDDTSWTEIQVITAHDADTGDNFGVGISGFATLFAGAPMAISDNGEHLIIAAHRWDDDILGIQTGCAYYFHYQNGQYVFQQQIIPSRYVDMSSSSFAWFGYKMAVSSKGRRLLIGCQGYHDGTDDTGSSFLFELGVNGYQFVANIKADSPTQWEYGGFSVALDGSGKIAAAGSTDYSGGAANYAGRVLLYDISAELAYTGVINKISGTTQHVNPIKMMSSVGNMNYEILDEDEDINFLLNELLESGYGARHASVDFYMGYEGLPFSNYIQFANQIISDDSEHNGAWQVRCEDIQRETRKEIFSLSETNITATIEVDDTTVSVRSTEGFQRVEHNSSYTDSPNATVGYFKVEDEVFSYTGTTETSFTGVVGGRFGTAKVRHEFDDDSATEADRQLDVEEFVYLELPIMKLLYAILTGELYGQPGQHLPDSWHLGISTQFIATTLFENIGLDLWDSTDATDATGFTPRFTGEEAQDGFKFIAEQILPLAGCYLRVLNDGQLAPKRMSAILERSSYDFIIDESNTIAHGALHHRQSKIHNRFIIDWNKNEYKQKLTRQNAFDDYLSQVVNNGIANPLTFEMRGLHGSRHAQSTLATRFNVLQDRYSGAPDEISIVLKHSMNSIEVGDVAFVNLPNVRDYAGNTRKLKRCMEVQNVTIDYVNGGVRVDLFGSTQKAYAQPPGNYASGGTTGLNSTFYTTGRAITSELTTSLIGDVLHITANGTLTGNSDLNDTSGTGSNFYYNGNVEIDEGVVVTIENNVHLRIGGFFQNNGKIDGKGNGIAGAAAGALATTGAVGTSISGGGMNVVYIAADATNWGPSTMVSTEGNTSQASFAPSGVVPALALENNSGILSGLPTDLRGQPGPGGNGVTANIDYFHPSLGYEDSWAGGSGGASGAGLAITCQGMEFGLLNQTVDGDGTIDLSGDIGQAGLFNALSGFGGFYAMSFEAGAGGSGHPGGLYINLDGSDSLYPDLSGRVVANISHNITKGYRHQGEATFSEQQANAAAGLEGLEGADLWRAGIASKHIHSNYVASHYDAVALPLIKQGGNSVSVGTWTYRITGPEDPTLALDVSGAISRVQYVPQNETAQEDISDITSAPTLATPVEYQNTPETAGENLGTMEVTITAPSDGNYSYSNAYYKTSTQGIEDYLFIGSYTSEFTVVAPMDGTQYNFLVKPVSITGVESDDGVTVNHTMSSTTGGLTTGSVAGWDITSSLLRNGTDIVLDSTNKAISINDTTFENEGIQLQHNSGSPQLYVGDGASNFMKYTTSAGLEIGSDTEVESADAYNNKFVQVIGQACDFTWSEEIVSGGSVSHVGGAGRTIINTAASGDRMRIYMGRDVHYRTMTWSHPRKFRAVLETTGSTSSANSEFEFITGLHASALANTGEHFGFYYVGGTFYASCAGASQTTTSIAGFTVNGSMELEAVFDPGVDIKYYVDGVLRATHTTNLPSGTQASNSILLFNQWFRTGGGNSNTWLGRIAFINEST